MMSAEDLLMEIQDCDELLYTSQEANLMLEYRDAVKRFDTQKEEEKEICNKLIAGFEQLNKLILEYEDRIGLTANNVIEPTHSEIAEMKKLFDKIESLDFETSELYESLIGEKL
jgi:hypothetical protein